MRRPGSELLSLKDERVVIFVDGRQGVPVIGEAHLEIRCIAVTIRDGNGISSKGK